MLELDSRCACMTVLNGRLFMITKTLMTSIMMRRMQ